VIYPELEEKLRRSELAFGDATSENIIELGERYLALLEEYIRELYAHPGAPNSNLEPGPSSSWEIVNRIKESVSEALSYAARERDRVSALLGYFNEMTVGEAVVTLNRQKYQGRDDWTLHLGVVRAADSGEDKAMTKQAAVDAASLLRREEYIARGVGP
jgi:hypothetical protein